MSCVKVESVGQLWSNVRMQVWKPCSGSGHKCVSIAPQSLKPRSNCQRMPGSNSLRQTCPMRNQLPFQPGNHREKSQLRPKNESLKKLCRAIYGTKQKVITRVSSSPQRRTYCLCWMQKLSPQATHPSLVLDAGFAATGGKARIQHKTPANCRRQ